MRFDMAGLRGVRVHPAGFLLIDARPTRTGIFRYRRPDGSVRTEYRPPEEVSRTDSLTTLRGASVTDLHPAEGRVSPQNVQALEVGSVTDAHMDGLHVVAELVVKRADAIEAVRAKKRVELSCGYHCDFDATPGTTSDGERYDGVQRNIRYNHVALLPAGTARGGPDCAMRLDANDAVLVDDVLLDAPNADQDGRSEERADQGDPPMRKIVIKGISFDAPEQTAQAVESQLTEDKQRLDAATAELATAKKTGETLTSELERTKAKADALQADLDKEKKLRTDASDPAKLRDLVKARVALERSATKVLGEEHNLTLDSLSDREIQEKVILHVHKDAKLEDKSPDYVAARFDSVVESHEPDERERGVDDARRRIDPPRQSERRDVRDERRDRDDDDEKNAIRTDATFRRRLGGAYREDLSVTR
jgi:uncharacterized protein